MRRLLTKLAVLSLVLLIPPLVLAADDHLVGGDELASTDKEIVKVTEKGLVPQTMTLKKLDGSVFFVNTTKDSLVTVAIDFGDRAGHCASANLKFENGTMHSIEPIGPKDFAVTCFPQSGTYEVKVEGVGARPVTGQIIVP